MSTQKKISELTSKTTSISHTDIFVCSQLSDGVYTSKKINGAQMFPYKIYTTTLSQSSTSNPTVSGTFNQLTSTMTWLRSSAGTYTIQCSANEFTGSTYVNITLSGTSNLGAYVRYTIDSISTITIYTYNSSNTLTDGVLNNASFEIKVINY
jgi:hypothetical protein